MYHGTILIIHNCLVGAIALAEVLAESKHLTHLDLKDNDIRIAGLMALQLGHRMNQTLISMETPKSHKVDQVRLCTVHGGVGSGTWEPSF